MQSREVVYLPPGLETFPIGARGENVRRMERESGAKIFVRGRGSVKEGQAPNGDEREEQAQFVVVAEDDGKVKHCVRLINELLAVSLMEQRVTSTAENNSDRERTDGRPT
ncbi:unnamed protein product [Tilletia controversa]|nr:unnamed protein product [Tilletia controversa]CAD6944492.1 unnamed protein product [Tilletia controversa]CAD6952384.1 unnamed protein product [Tilletia controversa]CAD6968356.1 unnamed protein product [Tilletia controversa]